jgi:ABC-2 type transport system ATP-binding protein
VAVAVVHAPRPDRDDTGEVVLETMGLGKRYRGGGPWALRDVDLRIPRGSITALVGPNGAGKSTLLRTWMGFERPTAGSVRVGGIDPQADRPAALRQLGYVSQATALYRGLTVQHHLDVAAELRPGFDGAMARDRLEQLAIPLDQRAGSLSGGQAAQVALCIALGTRAPVLLLDEPLASLDPLARHDFLNLVLAAAREQHTTVVLSSHIVSDVEAVCDRLVVVGQGRVTLQAPIADALAAHRLVPAADAGAADQVASFTRPGEAATALVHSQDPDLPTPTLEDLVMGYLAAARTGGVHQPGRER